MPAATHARRKTVAWASDSLTQVTVPKHRRPKFDLTLRIIDLNNVPLVSGISFVKWHLTTSAAAEHRGRTERRAIKEHKVTYDYEKHVPIRLTIQNKTKMLEESWIHFEVIQEYLAGGKSERITLGKVDLNLAEYVEASEHEADDTEGVVRRYLMQESKINSTLKIGIYMKQIEGERDYLAPTLKTAQVFGGIAGIIAGEKVESDDPGQIPTLSQNTRENGELQDMYRRTEIAFWAAQAGELRADECIEDIFSGGDGWGNQDLSPKHRWGHRSQMSRSSAHSSQETLKKVREAGGVRGHGHGHHLSVGSVGRDGVRGRRSLEQQANQMKAEAERARSRPSHEVDEFEVRENLRSWALEVKEAEG
ncbi:hypothetical protein K490DRAFT_31681 [Saccharata proteae CBS 121410]|uniref:C2 NT-type domain-containing protein n=1 Tax=Saccharata proteae CBS 121410 TaxID=1314787 RepID=A0A9P4M2I6_9PEZI|nr:hypothetical protein K490DRAFT_31681 [Saccharata proteae CBS 121410]